MMLQYTTYSMPVATAAVMAFCAASSAQPMFTGMGKVPSGHAGITDVANVYGITDTGIVYGHGDFSPMTWTSISGYKILLTLGQASFGNVYGCTADETLFFGRSFDEPVTRAVPVVWSDLNTVPDEIPGLPAGWSCLEFSVNSNGSVVVGNAEPIIPGPLSIFIWRDGPNTTKKKMQIIAAFPAPGANVGINDISDKGDRGVGGGYTSGIGSFFGVLWSQNAGFEYVFDVPGGASECGFVSCNWNANVAAGYATPIESNVARWTEFHGLSPLGKLLPTHNGSGGSKADDRGFVLTGTSELGPPSAGRTAVLWNPIDGMRSVEDVLVNDYGLSEVIPWQLTDVDAISPNGRYIAGRGLNPQGAHETWFAQITPFCYADCDGNDVLNIFDYICFGSEFTNQTIYANCDNDGAMNIFDYICFGNHFAEGCAQ